MAFRDFLAMSDEDRLAARRFPDEAHPASPTLEYFIRHLEHLAERDPVGMDIIRTRFFAEPVWSVDATHETIATVTMVEIIGPAPGRRRAGMTFGPEPRRFPIDVLSAGEIDALRADPLLTVGFTQVDADADTGFAGA